MFQIAAEIRQITVLPTSFEELLLDGGDSGMLKLDCPCSIKLV